MLHALIAALMQVASGDPSVAAKQPAPSVEPSKNADPQMICHWERDTGSNLKQHKVCKPKDAKEDPQSSSLQRALNRSGDILPPPATFGGK